MLRGGLELWSKALVPHMVLAKPWSLTWSRLEPCSKPWFLTWSIPLEL